MTDDVFAPLGDHYDRSYVPRVSVRKRAARLNPPAVAAIGDPPYVRVLVATGGSGRVRIVPDDGNGGEAIRLQPDGRIAGRLARYAERAGFAYGRYPATVENGVLELRLARAEGAKS